MVVIKTQFYKGSPHRISFNFSNGITAAITFKREISNETTMLNQIQDLFCCSYTHASIFVYRESNNNVEDMTERFIGRNVSGVGDAANLIAILYKVSCFK